MGDCAGMFNCMTYKPLPTYYSFVAFGELYQRKNQVYVGELPDKVYAVAAKSKDGCIVISNIGEKAVDINLDISGAGDITECKIITENAVWEDYTFQNQIPAESVICLKFKLSDNK